MPSRTARVVALGIVLAIAVACGGDDSATAPVPTADVPADVPPSPGDDFGSADLDFARAMIPHHAQALEMAGIALAPEAEAGSEVVDLATRVQATQDPEIRMMVEWLDRWGHPVDLDTMIGSDRTAHEAMGHAMDGMLSDPDMDELRRSRGADFDRRWLESMIEHHEGAVRMAHVVLDEGISTDVGALAAEIIAAQQSEIGEMRALLGAAPAPAPPTGADACADVGNFGHVHGVIIPSWAEDTLLVATHRGLVSYGDRGWCALSSEAHDLMALAADHDQPDLLYASGHPAPGSELVNPLGLLVSDDGGVSWEHRTLAGEVDFHALAMGRDGRLAGYDGMYGIVLTSEDRGTTWTAVAAPPGSTLSLAFSSEGSLFAATTSGLWEWTDDGDWTQRLAGEVVTAVAAVTSGDGEPALVIGLLDGLLHVSTDGGRSWSPLTSRPFDEPVIHIAPHPRDIDTLAIAGADGSVRMTRDGGSTWELLAEDASPVQPGEG